MFCCLIPLNYVPKSLSGYEAPTSNTLLKDYSSIPATYNTPSYVFSSPKKENTFDYRCEQEDTGYASTSCFKVNFLSS